MKKNIWLIMIAKLGITSFFAYKYHTRIMKEYETKIEELENYFNSSKCICSKIRNSFQVRL